MRYVVGWGSAHILWIYPIRSEWGYLIFPYECVFFCVWISWLTLIPRHVRTHFKTNQTLITPIQVQKWPQRCVAMGSPVGSLSKQAAQHLGLSPGTDVTVVQGGPDAYVGVSSWVCSFVRSFVRVLCLVSWIMHLAFILILDKLPASCRLSYFVFSFPSHLLPNLPICLSPICLSPVSK